MNTKDHLEQSLKHIQSALDKLTKDYNPEPEYFRNEMILLEASKDIGVVEYAGKPSNPKVNKYFDLVSVSGDSPYTDEVPWCFTGDVEILTEKGFQRFDELDKDLKVAEIDPNTHLLDFTKPIRHIEKEYTGNMFTTVHRNLKVSCDSGHQWYGDFNYSNKLTKKTLDEISSILSIPKPGGANGIKKDKKKLMLFASFLSDGFFKKSNKNVNHFNEMCIQVSKERKLKLLRTLGPKNEYTSDKIYGNSKKPLTTFSWNYQDYIDVFEEWQSDYKVISWEFINSLSKEDAEFFLNIYGEFDGNGNKNGITILYTSNIDLRDQLQIIALRAGYYSSYYSSISPTSGKTCYTIRISNKKAIHLKPGQFYKHETNNEKLYCVEVPKGIILLRDSNGNPFICGNCAAFVGAILKRCRMGHTGKLNAKSYLNWGKSTKYDPLPGDIVVYWRGKRNGWQGHVGFYLDQDDKYIYTLGGNQNNAVNISIYEKKYFLDFRRSSLHKNLTDKEKEKLKDYAVMLFHGKKIDSSKVVV